MVKLKFNNIRGRIKSPCNDLSQRTVRGGFWVFLLRIVQQIFGLARLVILARLLAPHDFGLMGIALLTMSTLETFSQTGFQQALIQKGENIDSYLDAAWTVLVIRGLVLFGILYFAAPFAASFFDVPEAKTVIQVLGLSVLFQGLTNIGVVYFQKELEFSKEFIYQFAGTLVDFTVAILAVLILRNVWALVFGLLAGNAVRCIMSYSVHPYRPRLSRNLTKVIELFQFGKWILGSSMLLFLITQGDNMFVGKYLGITALGLYQMAYRISNLPATEITHVISSVTFPAYSKLQNNTPKMKEAYLKVLQIIAFLSFPISGMIFVLAPDFTMIFLGEKWMPMVPAMQVLAVFGLIRALAATTGSLFHGSGNPHFLTKLSILQLGLLVVIIYPFTERFGIVGTSIAVLISNFITQIVTTLILVKLIKVDLLELIRIVAGPGVTTICIFLCFYFILPLLSRNIVVFMGVIILGTIIYTAIIYIIDRKYDLNYRTMLGRLLIGS